MLTTLLWRLCFCSAQRGVNNWFVTYYIRTGASLLEFLTPWLLESFAWSGGCFGRVIWAESYLVKQSKEPCLPPFSVNKDKLAMIFTFLLTHHISLKNFTVLQCGGFAFSFVQPKAGDSGHFRSCQETLLKPHSTCNNYKGCLSMGPAFGAHVGAALKQEVMAT